MHSCAAIRRGISSRPRVRRVGTEPDLRDTALGGTSTGRTGPGRGDRRAAGAGVGAALAAGGGITAAVPAGAATGPGGAVAAGNGTAPIPASAGLRPPVIVASSVAP